MSPPLVRRVGHADAKTSIDSTGVTADAPAGAPRTKPLVEAFWLRRADLHGEAVGDGALFVITGWRDTTLSLRSMFL